MLIQLPLVFILFIDDTLVLRHAAYADATPCMRAPDARDMLTFVAVTLLPFDAECLFRLLDAAITPADAE